MKRISGQLLLAGMLLLSSCGGYYHFTIEPRPGPPHYAQPMSPGTGYIWVEGEWFWNGRTYDWRNGYWARPLPGYRWESGHWKRRGQGWFWVPGRWRK